MFTVHNRQKAVYLKIKARFILLINIYSIISHSMWEVIVQKANYLDGAASAGKKVALVVPVDWQVQNVAIVVEHLLGAITVVHILRSSVQVRLIVFD